MSELTQADLDFLLQLVAIRAVEWCVPEPVRVAHRPAAGEPWPPPARFVRAGRRHRRLMQAG